MKTMLLVIAVVLANLFGSARAQDGDAENGERVFRRCQVCHAIGEGAANKVGPQLNGVVGRRWASVEGFSYSNDLVAGGEEGRVWDEATLHAYLENPKKVAPRGKMAFPGLRQAEERADVIAYIRQFEAQQ